MALIRKTILFEWNELYCFSDCSSPSSGAFSFSYPSERSLDPPPLISEYVFDFLSALPISNLIPPRSFRRQTRIYAHTLPRISSSAFLLLVWQRMTSALHLPASSTAHRTILWDTVFVKSTIRSGLPICLLKFDDIWVNTFALQLNTHILPPGITISAITNLR